MFGSNNLNYHREKIYPCKHFTVSSLAVFFLLFADGF